MHGSCGCHLRLKEQIELAQAALEQRPYIKQRVRSVKDESGVRSTVATQVRVKQWWFVADSGRVCLQVRYGTRILELAKGKNSIEVGSGTELITVLETVKKCVESGELDSQIESASSAVRARFKLN